MRVEQGYQPTPFKLPHPFTDDLVLPSLLKRLLPKNIRTNIENDLVRFGDDINGPVRSLASRAEYPPPSVTQYDQWGRRIDQLNTSEGWRALKAIAIQEGLVSISYERKYGPLSRIYAAMKIIMWKAEDRMTLCPLGMTDGAARVLELLGTPEMKAEILSRLISRDPVKSFTAGQFMTERPGGSNLSQTETTAVPLDPTSPSNARPGTLYTLTGFKWFSSATDGDIALALARTGSIRDGSRSLSLFLLPLHWPLVQDHTSPPSTRNGVQIHRLKNKIGTHALPTAELSLNSSVAYLVGPPTVALNQGVKSISTVLNITRIYSSMHSVGNLGRCLAIACAFARVRRIPGDTGPLLTDFSLHTSTLAKPALVYRALAHFTFGVVSLWGKTECGTAGREEASRLRLLTPVLKAFTAENAVASMEECMVALGGQGYMEENDIGRLIRDGLVEKIWEGTINVLSLDVVRSTTRNPETMPDFLRWAKSVINSASTSLSKTLQPQLEKLLSALDTLSTLYLPTARTAALVNTDSILPRPALFLLGHVASAIYLLEHAIWSCEMQEPTSDIDEETFRRWIAGLQHRLEEVAAIRDSDGASRERMDESLVYGKL